MATPKNVLINRRWFLGGSVSALEISGDSNRAQMVSELPEKTYQTWELDAINSELGLERVSVELEVLARVGAVTEEEVTWATRGKESLVGYFGDSGGAVGSAAYAAVGLGVGFEKREAVGELESSVIRLAGKGVPWVRGKVAENGMQRSAAGQGSGLELPELATAAYLYGFVWVYEIAGGNLTLEWESDGDDLWLSPVTRISHPAVTATAAMWARVSAPTPDTWLRLKWSGTFTSFRAAAVAGAL